MQNFKERIFLFVQATGVSTREFERNCGLANGTISAIGAQGPTAIVLKKIADTYPALAQQHLNEWIKKICEKCGIDTPVEVTTFDGRTHKTTTKKKYEMVSSHTARRTGITLLYMTGIPLQQVMLISGHKDEDSIRHYLRLSKEENVALLKDNPFFK